MQQVSDHELIIGKNYDIIVKCWKTGTYYKYNGYYNGIIYNQYSEYPNSPKYPSLYNFINVKNYTNNKIYKKICFQYNDSNVTINEFYISIISLQEMCYNQLSPVQLGYLKDFHLNKKSLGIC